MNKKSRVEFEMVEGYLAMVRERVFLGRKVDLEDVGVIGYNKEDSEQSIMPQS